MRTVLVVGSSIFAQWEQVDAVAPGCRVVNRARGGTITAYWVKHLTVVHSEVSPDTVLFYCGSNDLNADVPDATIVETVFQCRALLPGAAFVYFSIIKAPQKLGKWERIDAINAAIRACLAPGDLYIESNTVFFPDGAPAAHFFVEDGLHLTDEAYEVLTDYTRPLLATWSKQHEGIPAQNVL